MSNIFKSPKDIDIIKQATEISTDILRLLKNHIVLDSSAYEIDLIAGDLMKSRGVISSFKGVQGNKSKFPSNVCVMNNDESVHAIPNSQKPFQNGDIVKIDIGIIYEGFFTDHGTTVGIGDISGNHKNMIETVKLSVDESVKQAIEGNFTGDISFVLGSISNLGGYDSVLTYAGHGIGKYIHTSPTIPFVGRKGEGAILKEGMLICVENWITDGNAFLQVDEDGWTDRTKDGSISAFHELMVLVGKDKPTVLTHID